MALLTAQFRSNALAQDTSITVILPDTTPADDIPTLYLLHGMHSDFTGWERKTNIERYAIDRKIAVVMPDGGNSFYHDMKYGKNYFTYVTEELIAYTRRFFRLSHKREKTFICGLSMGGYGAFYLCLRRPDLYAGCASLSGCLDIVSSLSRCKWEREASAIWGDDFATSVKGTSSDLMHLIDTFPADMPKPRMFASCGRQDFLYQDNLTFRDHMAGKDFDFTYREGEGVHNWAFWDEWVAPAIDHLMQ